VVASGFELISGVEKWGGSSGRRLECRLRLWSGDLRECGVGASVRRQWLRGSGRASRRAMTVP
jgi:hypothetical protein